jgi:hypothetical protein
MAAVVTAVARRRLSSLWPRVTPTQDQVAATQSRVTTIQARKKIGERRNRPRWTSTWSSRSDIISCANRRCHGVGIGC